MVIVLFMDGDGSLMFGIYECGGRVAGVLFRKESRDVYLYWSRDVYFVCSLMFPIYECGVRVAGVLLREGSRDVYLYWARDVYFVFF